MRPAAGGFLGAIRVARMAKLRRRGAPLDRSPWREPWVPRCASRKSPGGAKENLAQGSLSHRMQKKHRGALRPAVPHEFRLARAYRVALLFAASRAFIRHS